MLWGESMLELTVLVCGTLTMVLEMVGARVLAPHVGSSAVVWTSLIGVMLASLALGAWAGGRIADRKTSRQGLACALTGAGLGCSITALCHASVGHWAATVVNNLYVAAMLAALCVLSLPAFFLGMITPYAIRLRIERVASSGSTVGRLYALSTVGSIAGTFLGGFILVSYWGSTVILWGVAACMFALAVWHVGLHAKSFKGLAATCVLCLSLAVLAAQQRQVEPGPDFLLESPYNSIRVFDACDYGQGGRPVRLLATDPGYCQSGMYLDAPEEPYFRYTQFYALGPFFVPQAERILMLGGGGYSVPKWFLSHNSPLARPERLQLTVVEIDPAMTETARQWFALSDDVRLKVRHEDARSYLNRQSERYDLVLVDVFNSHYAVPFQMGTAEAAVVLRRAVAPGGLLLMNVISSVEGPDGRLVQALCHALQGAFAEVQLYCAGEQAPDVIQNIMILAFPEKRETSASAYLALKNSVDSPDIEGMLATRYRNNTLFAISPMTDDFAPVEKYTIGLQRQ